MVGRSAHRNVWKKACRLIPMLPSASVSPQERTAPPETVRSPWAGATANFLRVSQRARLDERYPVALVPYLLFFDLMRVMIDTSFVWTSLGDSFWSRINSSPPLGNFRDPGSASLAGASDMPAPDQNYLRMQRRLHAPQLLCQFV